MEAIGRLARVSETAQLEVYTDGQCPLCCWMRARVEPFDRERQLEWLDFHSPAALRRAAPRTREQLSEAMHVRRKATGVWAEGFHAWLEVLGVLPRLRRLAWALSCWPLTALGPVFYRQLAKRRYQLFGIPPPCDEAGVCQIHTRKR
ncbi:MAG: thiol-disulfide oxidoreductase DCC family protein [Pyrinomonadaceae bacterium]|jgi:predicted DCC family thiol-disulfide oxidoreductase YuxK